jgi:pSer/pThr/pTyr-binding forkhead associated (FHA) protein
MLPKVTLTIENGQLAGRVFEFDEPQTCLVGRSPECAVALPQRLEFGMVSRKHLMLDINPPALRVRDAGSRNGTRLNGMEIGRPEAASRPLGYSSTVRELRRARRRRIANR